MTENKAKQLGFKLVKQYDHDQFNTNRYKKGLIELEFTYEAGELVRADVTMDEVVGLELTESEIITLDKIVNK